MFVKITIFIPPLLLITSTAFGNTNKLMMIKKVITILIMIVIIKIVKETITMIRNTALEE